MTIIIVLMISLSWQVYFQCKVNWYCCGIRIFWEDSWTSQHRSCRQVQEKKFFHEILAFFLRSSRLWFLLTAYICQSIIYVRWYHYSSSILYCLASYEKRACTICVWLFPLFSTCDKLRCAMNLHHTMSLQQGIFRLRTSSSQLYVPWVEIPTNYR